jgi:hypothetical protein
VEKIGWTDLMKSEEEILRINEERNILRKIKGKKANRKSHFLRRNCFLNYAIDGKIERRIEVTGKRGR